VQPFLQWKRVAAPLLVDVNEYAAEVYRHNFPTANYSTLNLKDASSTKISGLVGGKVDILLGCPPCQGYSDTGSRRPRDPRNSHITQFSQFVRDLKPLAVGMENVPLLAESSRFNSFIKVIESLEYLWTASIVNAALYGSCQSRQRLLFVAIRKDVGVQPLFSLPQFGGEKRYYSYSLKKTCRLKDDPVGILGRTPGTLRTSALLPQNMADVQGSKPIPTVWDVISDLPRIGSKEAVKDDHVAWEHTSAILRRMKHVHEGGRWSGGKDHFSQAYGRLHRQGLARTITTYLANPGSGRFWHPVQNRALTLREAARIQGFPDSFKFLSRKSDNCVLVGNALDSVLAGLTYETIRKCLE
jgi:DNA (cytosine-5)-methyltransferase 1